jgi:diguanylate cyclase (GGDEF)-like protein
LATLVSGFGLVDGLYADGLSPAAAGKLAASAQEVAQAVDFAWETTDNLFAPLIGPAARMRYAEAVGELQQVLGAPRQSAVAWKRVAQFAERLGDTQAMIAALDETIALALAQGDYDAANSHAGLLLDRARATGNIAAQAAAEGYLGVFARRRGQLEAARSHQETALSLRRALHDRSGEAQVLMNLGTVHRDLGDYARALELQLDALELRKALGPGERLDLSYRNIALLYREIEDTEQAKANFKAALAASMARHDPQSLAAALGSYASFSNDIGDAEAALTMARQALAIDASLGNRPYIGLEQIEIARALTKLGRDHEALAPLDEALAIGRELRHREIVGNALLYLGRLALRAGDEAVARERLDEAIAVLTEAKLKAPLSEAFGAREEVAQARGELANALVYAHRRNDLREELLGTRSGRKLAALKSRYERAEADQRIRLLSLDNEVQSLRLREQALLRNVGVAIGLSLAVLLVVLWNRYRVSRRLNHALERKNAEISAHETALRDVNAKLSTQAAELYQAAITDPLTGAYNRGHLMRQLDQQMRHALQDGRDLAVLMIDFDHFKRINDEHGHLFGDRVLASGVQIMRQWLEPGDMLGRYGGEEFIAVLPDRDEMNAHAIAERLRDKVEFGLTPLTGSPRPLTISIGLASLQRSGSTTLEELLSAADAAVYRAKADGRNRVVPYAA